MALAIAQLETLLEELEELKASRNSCRYLLKRNKLSLPCGLKLNDALEYADMQFEEKSYPICERIDKVLRHKKLSLLPYDFNHKCDLCQGKNASYALTRTIFGSHSRRCVNYVCNAPTCGHNYFLMKERSQSILAEDTDAFLAFYTRLSTTASARETAQ